MKKTYLSGAMLIALVATPAMAGSPIPIAQGITLEPLANVRFRYEAVSQDNAAKDADAVTVRIRPGLALESDFGLGVLSEMEGTLAIGDAYNSTVNGKTAYSVVADPENIELNQLEVHYRSKVFSITGGRQRINLDDQRFVGSVGWRQNDQTFDAVRSQVNVGPVSLDGTYAISQRTIFGIDAGPREHFDGDYIFVGAGVPLGPIKVKGFAYLLDYDAGQPVSANSTQTYGVRAAGSFKLSSKVSVDLAASYASQSDYKANATDYTVSYIAAEAGLGLGNYGVKAGYELLGSDNGKSFQTPMATLHKFNGWADMFLSTPGAGLQDFYVGASAKFPTVKALPGLNAAVNWHSFSADVGGAKYGTELDAQIGFKVAKQLGLLLKYADYQADSLSVDTRKIWFQVEFGL